MICSIVCQTVLPPRRSPDDRKKTQTAVVWSCFPFIRSGQNHLARHSERGRRQGRQRKRWEDNIREWIGLEFAKSQRAVENRENGGIWLWNHLWCRNDPRGKCPIDTSTLSRCGWIKTYAETVSHSHVKNSCTNIPTHALTLHTIHMQPIAIPLQAFAWTCNITKRNIILYSSQREIEVAVRSQTLKHTHTHTKIVRA